MDKDWIFLMGIGCSGKTSLITTYLGGPLEWETTICNEYRINIVVDKKKYQFHVFDSAAIDDCSDTKFYARYLVKSVAVIIVIDVFNPVGEQFDLYYQLIQRHHPGPCDICVIVNRLDYLKNDDTETLNEIKALMNRLDELKIMHFETSLKFIQVHPLQNYLEHLVDIGYGKLIP